MYPLVLDYMCVKNGTDEFFARTVLYYIRTLHTYRRILLSLCQPTATNGNGVEGGGSSETTGTTFDLTLSTYFEDQ